MDNLAMRNRSIRAIQMELEFLAEAQIITDDVFRQISSLLPEPVKASSESTLPVATPAPLKRVLPVATPAPLKQDYTTNAQVKAVSEKQQAITHDQQEDPPSYVASIPKPPFRCQAAWDYNKPPKFKEGDLTFDEEDYILVSRVDNESWWTGRVIDKGTGLPFGKPGLFPANYVKVVQQTAIQDNKPPLPSRVSGSEPHGDNMMMNVAHEGSSSTPTDDKGKNKMQENGAKFGKKLGNAAIFGAGATIGSKIVNGIF